jgi:acyl-CoA thioesterase FadM
MSDLAIEFKSESFYPDQIEVAIHAAEITKVSFELYYQLSVQRENEKILLANAKTGMVCYDYAAKKVVGVPEKLLGLLKVD